MWDALSIIGIVAGLGTWGALILYYFSYGQALRVLGQRWTAPLRLRNRPHLWATRLPTPVLALEPVPVSALDGRLFITGHDNRDLHTARLIEPVLAWCQGCEITPPKIWPRKTTSAAPRALVFTSADAALAFKMRWG